MGCCAKFLQWSMLVTLVVAVAIGTIQQSAARQPYVCTLFGIKCPKYIIKGMVAKGWDVPAQMFRNNFELFREQHAQLTVYHGENVVIDLYGVQEGHNHKRAGLLPAETSTLPYDHDSLQVVFSSSKAVTSLVIAMAVDRGYFKYTDRVAQYWPEFAAHNKDDITIEDMMRHEGRLSHLSRRISFTELADLDSFAKVLAESPTVLPKGYRGYHAVTRGFFLNELIRRTDPKHRSIGQFIKEEIAIPLGVEKTMMMGIANEDASVRQRLFETSQDGTPSAIVKTLLPAAVHHLHAYLEHTPVGGITRALFNAFPISPVLIGLISRLLDKNSTVYNTMHVISEAADGTPKSPNTYTGLAYESPSSGMVTNSRAMAAVAALIANGGELNGVRLLKESTVDEALSGYVNQYDHVLGLNTTMGRGGWGRNYGLVFADIGGSWHGWAGWGGSRLTFNRERQIGIGYAQTRMGSGLGGLRDERTDSLFMAIAQAHDEVMANQ